MPKIRLISVGNPKHKGFQALEADYAARLKHYTDFETVCVNDSRKENPLQRTEEECGSLLKKVPAGATLIGLDVTGRALTTEALAAQIQNWDNQSTRQVAFAIGGPYGFSESFRKTCAWHLSLSALTLPHEMARVVLIEQLYRAYTILRGEKYHHS